MIKYLIQDLAGTIRYIPYGMVIGVGLLLVVHGINRRRQRQGKAPRRLMAPVCFFTYLALMLIITFLSREGGNMVGMDLEIGSSLKINTRNDAYAVENILLFMPYGFCFAWYRKKRGIILQSFLVGLFTSLIIEIMQLVTGRGIFQIDDIITNTLGCVIGGLVFTVLNYCFKKMRN